MQMKTTSVRKISIIVGLCFILLLSACGNAANNSDNGAASENESPAASNNQTNESEAPPAEEPTEEPAEERVLTDGLGNEVTVPANPERVIATYLEDHLIALDTKPVAQWSVNDGASVQNYLQNDLNGIPTIPHDLPFEVVLSHDPDLIIVASADLVSGEKYAQYAEIAPTYVLSAEQSADWRKGLLTVGEVLGKSEEAQAALDSYDEYVAGAKEQLAIGDKSAAVLWVADKAVYMVSKQASSGVVLYNDLGFAVPEVVEKISSTATAHWNAISEEEIANLNADYLFLVNSDGKAKETVMNNPVWKGIPAVANKQVFEFGTEASWLYSGTIANKQIIDDVLKTVAP